MQYIIQGFIIGLAYVAPIGTQNMFVINTALTQPRKRVFLTALIVMFFDITLALACFFGIGTLISKSPLLELLLVGVGSFVVIKIGIDLLRAHSTLDTSGDTNIPLAKVLGTACVVTWFNPQAIIDGSIYLGSSRITLPGAPGLMFIGGVCLASAFWWLAMSTIVNSFRAKFTDKTLRIINIVCGVIILCYGAKLLLSGWKMLQAMIS